MGKWDEIFDDLEVLEESDEDNEISNDNYEDEEDSESYEDDEADKEKSHSKRRINVNNKDLKIIGFGITILGLAITIGLLWRTSSNKVNKSEEEKETVAKSESYEKINEAHVDKKENSEWKEFSGEVEFNSIEEIELNFVVTGCRNYVRQISSNEIQLRTSIEGAISGLDGKYNIDVDFSIINGKSINIGDSFLVIVKLADYEGKKAITNIKIKE